MKLFATLHDEAQQGWIWLQDLGLPPHSIVKITNPANGRTIYCETLQIDSNFLSAYNQGHRHTISDPQSSLVISGWYRAKLGGLQTQANVPLHIKQCNSWWGHFKACTDHPQVVVRVAVWLGFIGVILGIISLVFSIISLR